ncbi:MAG: GldG family protein [Myxococcales bacterium]|nr:GldG family protein [Myxococcales bacterium]
MTKKITQVLGIAGLIAFTFSVLIWAATGDTSPYVLMNMFGGLALMVVYLMANFGAFKGGIVGRQTRYGANSVLYSVGVLAALVAVNFIVQDKAVRKDFTANKLNSLSDKSMSILKGLGEDLEVYGFYQESEGQDFDKLEDLYSHASKKISFQKVNPETRPDLAERFEVSAYGSIIVKPKDGTSKVKIQEATEEALTNAITKVTEASQKVVYFLTGHDEGDINDDKGAKGLAVARAELEGENYKVAALTLGSPDFAVPADAAALIIAGPQRRLLDEELKAIRTYLEAGGKAVILDDANTSSGIESALEPFGVTLGNDAIIGIQQPSPIERLLNPNAKAVPTLTQTIRKYGEHKIVEKFKEPLVLQVVRSVTPKADVAGYKATTLASTADNSWAETDLVRLFTENVAQEDDSELKGPISVAVAIEGAAKTPGVTGTTRIVVVGDADFATNKYIFSLFNRDFFLNAVNWAVGESEKVAIGKRVAKASSVDLAPADVRKIFYLGVLAAPQALLIAGLGIWWWRR